MRFLVCWLVCASCSTWGQGVGAQEADGGEVPQSETSSAPEGADASPSPQPQGDADAPAPPSPVDAVGDVSAGDASDGEAPAGDAASADATAGGKSQVVLKLKDAIVWALENNLDIEIARTDDKVAQRDRVIAAAVFDPFFNVGATYAKNRDPSVSFLELGGVAQQEVAVNPSESLSYSLGLGGDWFLGTRYDFSLQQVQIDRPAASAGGITFLNPITTTRVAADFRQPLLSGAGTRVNTADLRVAHNNARISREDLEQVIMETVLSVETAYWEMVFAFQNLQSKENALGLAQDNVSNTEKKLRVGTVAQIDLVTAQSQVALRKVELEDAKLLVQTNRDNLLDKINYSRGRSLRRRWTAQEADAGGYNEYEITCSSELDVEPQEYDLGDSLAAAFERRPEYRRAQLTIENEGIRTDAARNRLLPQLDLLARWTQLGLEEQFDDSYDEFGSGRYYNWLVGLEFSVPLSRRGDRNRYRNARSQMRRARLQLHALENQIFLEVDQTIREIRSLEQRVADLDERVRLQAILLEAEKRKLNAGTSVAYTVSTIENDLVEDTTQALRARVDLQNARARLRKATGESLFHHGIEVMSQ